MPRERRELPNRHPPHPAFFSTADFPNPQSTCTLGVSSVVREGGEAGGRLVTGKATLRLLGDMAVIGWPGADCAKEGRTPHSCWQSWDWSAVLWDFRGNYQRRASGH